MGRFHFCRPALCAVAGTRGSESRTPVSLSLTRLHIGVYPASPVRWDDWNEIAVGGALGRPPVPGIPVPRAAQRGAFLRALAVEARPTLDGMGMSRQFVVCVVLVSIIACSREMMITPSRQAQAATESPVPGLPAGWQLDSPLRLRKASICSPDPLVSEAPRRDAPPPDQAGHC